MATPRPLLRLKRTAAVALDELAVTLPPSKRSRIDSTAESAGLNTPQTLRFRRLPSPNASSSNAASSVKNRRVIDIDLSELLDSPGPSPSPVVKSTPDKPDENKSSKPTVDMNSNKTPDKAPENPKEKDVFDLYEQFDGSAQDTSKDTRVGWLNSSILPSIFFGELLPSDDEDDEDYSDEEGTVDYPSTPSSSNDGSDVNDSDADDISDGEISALHAANPDWATVFGTRSRFRDRKFDGASDSEDQPQAK